MPKTLLLADDSVTIQKVVGITFANEDVELVTVDNGTDALARAKQIFPDLVLADIGMPGMDGYELCAAIRRTPELARIPVLLLTGTFESYDETRARAAGASGHISKPFEAQALVDRVWALLAEAEAAQSATVVADPLDASDTALKPDDELLVSLPELPNSSFGITDPGLRTTRPPLPAPQAGDLPDLLTSRGHLPAPPLEHGGDPLADSLLAARRAPSPARSQPEPPPPPAPSFEDLANSETAFLDPLQDLTPPLARPPASPAASPLLPPAEPPDFLDFGSFDPQGDTNPTYADGSRIRGDVEESQDPRIASGESLALVMPDVPEVPGLPASPSERSTHTEPLLEVQELPEVDPLDLEPLESPDPRGSTQTRTEVPVAGARALVPPAPPSPAAAPTIDAGALHGALEKLAWEAFGSLSQELVEQFTRRLEAILWEVVPAVAERLVREEIARLKGDS